MKTWKITSGMRWVKNEDNSVTLQQAWTCLETGEIEWRDVPIFNVADL